METKDVRTLHVRIERMVESVLHEFQETTLDRCVEAIVETKVINLLETVSYKALKGENTFSYQAVKKVVHRVVTRDAINEVVLMRADNLA